MSKVENINELIRKVNQCVRCGQCRSVCPIFRELGVESAVARGKLALLRDYLHGKDVSASAVNELLSKCLLCKTCGAQCPSGVHADELVLAGREVMVERQGLPLIKKAVFAVLKRRALFDLGLAMAALGQDIGLKRNPGSRLGAVSRFPMPGLAKRRVIAPFAVKPLRKQFPETIRVAAPQARVALFTGCMANYIYTDAGKAAIEVLTAHNIEVVLPKWQHCCGFPLITSGDAESGRLMGRHNIQVFSELQADAVITLCGSCGSAWRHEYPRLFAAEPEYLEKANAIAKKTYDILEYLADVFPLNQDLLGPVNMKITIHDPCHLVRGMGVAKQVRKVVKAIPGVKLIEMKEADRCCGSGGSFNLSYYELSRKINDRKMDNIAATKADTVVAGCGSCRMHLIDGLCQKGQPQNVIHTIQLVAQSIEAKRAACLAVPAR